jgi:GNAT superfamily N-acetyltransferase
MRLADGYTDLVPGKMANVVTCLEMFARPEPRPDPPGVQCALERVIEPDLGWYRALFRRVGAPYLWHSRLAMSDEELERVIRDSRVEIYAVRQHGRDVGILELDFRCEAECELTFAGLVSDVVGTGIGRWLMNRALDLAWSHPIERFWVHTCTLDHPSAVRYYMASGFVPFKRQIEIGDDPRVCGLLPRSAAPEVPII